MDIILKAKIKNQKFGNIANAFLKQFLFGIFNCIIY